MFHTNFRGAVYRTLKLLDVRENGIAVSVPQEAVAAIEASALEELLLEGEASISITFLSF